MNALGKIFSSDYGMLAALLGLCIYFSLATYAEQHPEGVEAAERLYEQIEDVFPDGGSVVVLGRPTEESKSFCNALNASLKASDWKVLAVVNGDPFEAGRAIRKAFEDNNTLSLVACESSFVELPLFEVLREDLPAFGKTRLLAPESYNWPNFLKADNLLNVANQIAVIAILAIGMTMVIVTAGIDLSVGSLIAFSAVLATWLIREYAGGVDASALGMFLCSLLAILACGLFGFFTGGVVTFFQVPPFVATLGMMLVGSGLAYMLSNGLSIYQLPEDFSWLGRGVDLFGIPNAVVLMLFLYLVAHIVMERTSFGRYVYAVGGNPEAARLSGVPVRRVLICVYCACGALAGLGGVVMASQFLSGDPKYGLMYELYVIAAVVVGGTSLSGGQGKIFGTLIGAFIIAVIRNGMNLTGVESYTQKVVLGLVLLAAVLLDMLKKRGFKLT